MADWYSKLNKKEILCLNLLMGACGGRGVQSIPNSSAVLKSKSFNSLGFITTGEMWKDYLEPNWFNDAYLSVKEKSMAGWDWSVLHNCLRNRPELYCLQPLKARVKHIGDYGTYSNPTFNKRIYLSLIHI